jgi:hypothetical protein
MQRCCARVMRLSSWGNLVRIGAVTAAICVCSGSGLAQDNSSDAWKPLRFLIGTWEAKTQGGSAGSTGSGTYSFELELKGHILARHSSGAGEHGDLLYIYQDAPSGAYKAIYFDNEGHVIHYEVSIQSATSVVFLSDQFRLSYELNGATMVGKFQVRAPGQAAFKPYLEWSGGKK